MLQAKVSVFELQERYFDEPQTAKDVFNERMDAGCG
jgi:hypothetical protein